MIFALQPMSFIKGSLLVQYKQRPVSLISQPYIGKNRDGKRVIFELRFSSCRNCSSGSSRVVARVKVKEKSANPGKAASIEIPTVDSRKALDERLRLRRKQS